MQYVKDYYDAISIFDISLSIPLWLALERPRGNFSSVIIETADSLDSINATTSSIVGYVSQKQASGSEQDRSVHWDHQLETEMLTHTGVISLQNVQSNVVQKQGVCEMEQPIVLSYLALRN